MICRRCGEEVPTVHAHKYGLNGYRCQLPPTKQATRRLLAGDERD